MSDDSENPPAPPATPKPAPRRGPRASSAGAARKGKAAESSRPAGAAAGDAPKKRTRKPAAKPPANEGGEPAKPRARSSGAAGSPKTPRRTTKAADKGPLDGATAALKSAGDTARSNKGLLAGLAGAAGVVAGGAILALRGRGKKRPTAVKAEPTRPEPDQPASLAPSTALAAEAAESPTVPDA